ncbi:Uu.00g041530.m01.CDS01 [Anthostomella pinea]|uniref:Uu.00g041530.m01.CDS01 n=1 Tax=Anthostomella pinea TaxID=933095 RepID=A0AAI8YE09_9PEZI|nr:Uu.00g041530.m01.CDS01 [Anthostomella pinea]
MRLPVLSIGLLALLTPLASAWSKEDREIFRVRDELSAHEGPEISFYDFLGVTPSASQDEINKAYKKRTKLLHPDKVKQQLTAERAKQKSKTGKKKPGVTVTKPPTQPEIKTAIKEAGERQARLSIVTNVLRGPGRARYDHFIANGFPTWKGTEYYYSRYRPGLGTVLFGCLLVGGGLFHYVALYMSWKRQREFVERYIKFARHAAWGDNLGIPGVDAAAPAPPPHTPPAADDDQPPMPVNRKQRRMQEQEARKKSAKDGKRSNRGRGRAGQQASGSATPVPQPQGSGPSGAKKRIVAENGKVLVVDSLGDVYLEQQDADGNTGEFLLDPDELQKPTIRDTALFKLPGWAYAATVGKVLGQSKATDSSDDEAGGSDEELVDDDEDSDQPQRTPSTDSADDFEILEKSVEDLPKPKTTGSQAQDSSKAKRRNKKSDIVSPQKMMLALTAKQTHQKKQRDPGYPKKLESASSGSAGFNIPSSSPFEDASFTSTATGIVLLDCLTRRYDSLHGIMDWHDSACRRLDLYSTGGVQSCLRCGSFAESTKLPLLPPIKQRSEIRLLRMLCGAFEEAIRCVVSPRPVHTRPDLKAGKKIDERGHQVQLMPQIYSGANCVFIYIEEAADDSGYFLDTLNSDRSISWTYLKDYIDQKYQGDPAKTPLLLRLDFHFYADPERALHLLDLARESNANAPRDKVFAVRGLAIDLSQNGIVADYNLRVEQVYTQLALHLSSRYGWTAILLRADTDHRKIATLPSWVPDWSNYVYTSPDASMSEQTFLKRGSEREVSVFHLPTARYNPSERSLTLSVTKPGYMKEDEILLFDYRSLGFAGIDKYFAIPYDCMSPFTFPYSVALTMFNLPITILRTESGAISDTTPSSHLEITTLHKHRPWSKYNLMALVPADALAGVFTRKSFRDVLILLRSLISVPNDLLQDWPEVADYLHFRETGESLSGVLYIPPLEGPPLVARAIKSLGPAADELESLWLNTIAPVHEVDWKRADEFQRLRDSGAEGLLLALNDALWRIFVRYFLLRVVEVILV